MQTIYLPQAHDQSAFERAETLQVIWTYLNGLACQHHNDEDDRLWEALTNAGTACFHAEKHYRKEAK